MKHEAGQVASRKGSRETAPSDGARGFESLRLHSINSGAGQVASAGFAPEARGFESPRLHSLREEEPMSSQVATFPQAGPVAVDTTHEQFIHAIRRIVARRLDDVAARERLLAAKLVYGGGQSGIRGLCYYQAWKKDAAQDFIEVAAISQESLVQIAGTTIHELGHCLAGFSHGHGAGWKDACKTLGLSTAHASGQSYTPADFASEVWAAIEQLPKPSDGAPAFRGSGDAPKRKPCPLGIGTRGGRSRGTGSGSRMRLYQCECPDGTPGRKIRSATDELDATCNRCGRKYLRA